ncbi:unnamed protein product [Lampetra planeri]
MSPGLRNAAVHLIPLHAWLADEERQRRAAAVMSTTPCSELREIHGGIHAHRKMRRGEARPGRGCVQVTD